MTRTLKSIAPLQLGKILAVLYGLISIVFVPFFLIFAIIGIMMPSPSGSAAGSMVGMIFMMILMPVFYVLTGFVTGVVGGWLYNIIAKWIGGIQVEIE